MTEPLDLINQIEQANKEKEGTLKTEILVKHVNGLRTATTVNENSGEVEHRLVFRATMTDGDHDRLVHIFKQKVPVELLITAPTAKSDFKVQLMLDLQPKPSESIEVPASAVATPGEDSLTTPANREAGKEQTIQQPEFNNDGSPVREETPGPTADEQFNHIPGRDSAAPAPEPPADNGKRPRRRRKTAPAVEATTTGAP